MFQQFYIFFFIVFFSLNLSSCGGGGGSSQAALTGTPLQAATTVVQKIEQLQNGASGALSPFTSLFDTDGVRFAPYYNLVASDLKLTSAVFEDDWNQQPIKTWGTQDGSGDPINLHVQDYFSRFVWNFPYHTNATVTLINTNSDFHSSGNIINNMFTVYSPPQYRIVAYHQPGIDSQFSGMDWSSLIVVLKDLGNSEWSLVALVHGSWTI